MKTWILDEIPEPATLGLRPGNPALARPAARQLCKTHPGVDYKVAWGCPLCVRDLRADNARLRAALAACEFRITDSMCLRASGGLAWTKCRQMARAALALAEGGGL